MCGTSRTCAGPEANAGRNPGKRLRSDMILTELRKYVLM
ncbi:Uncharacterised protein [Amycolatopsis camponoti]|uniref:Uncharacterized protein n=1 Tax=Amycolatopsis camponoti TaxID=2606593 RepID=A0A6I8LLG1_9PSEU|nr:Uncharacterised protein [Amycolatopsis camponoti]